MTEKAILKNQLKNVPIKFLLSLLVAKFVAGADSLNIFEMIFVLVILYGLMSCLSIFSKAVHNWFLGIILFIIVVYLLANEVLPSWLTVIIVCFMFLWGVIRDLYRLCRLLYITVKKKEEDSPFGDNESMAYSDSADINRIIEEYNRAVAKSQDIFETINDVILKLKLDPCRFKKLLSEYEDITAVAKSIAEQLKESSALTSVQMENCSYKLRRCCLDMQMLTEKQNRYLEELSKGMWRKDREEGKGTSNVAGVVSFFSGCESMESLTKRYRDLCKVYHPDMGNGSSEIFTKIQEEYEILKKRF